MLKSVHTKLENYAAETVRQSGKIESKCLYCTSVVRGPPGRRSSLVCRSDWCWGLFRSGRVGLVERRTGMIARVVVGSGFELIM
jgi:hypothetical protein